MLTNFKITVCLDNQEYQVEGSRTSPGVKPNQYHAAIMDTNKVSNKYPVIIYTSVDGKLLYEDRLKNLLPGFAEIVKDQIMKIANTNMFD